MKETLTLPVEGMTCASCVTRVEKALKKVEGVDVANVNFATEKVTLTFDSSLTSEQQLASVVEQAGYKLVIPKAQGASRAASQQETSNETGNGDEAVPSAYRKLRAEFILSSILTLPIMVISMISMTEWFMRISPFSMEEINKLLLIATTILLVISGKRFYIAAARSARHLSADMNTLVAVGTGTAYVYSLIAVVFPDWLSITHASDHIYFDTAATIITLILMGRLLEARAKAKTTSAITKLLGLQPKTARVMRSGQEYDISIAEVVHDDSILIRPGEKIPVDGIVTKGFTTVDEAMITGESIPVEKKIGSNVIGGTINNNGSIEFKATAVGSETVIANIVRLVEQAQGSKAPIQSLVDNIAGVFVPVVISLAVVTFLGWLIVGDAGFTGAMVNFIAVLIIACPCALGLATPTAIMVGAGLGAMKGILIKNAESLERAHRITTIVLDKTGTITEGKPKVVYSSVFNGMDERNLLEKIAAVENMSEHPLARAIVEHARSKNILLSRAESFQSYEGIGVSGVIDNDAIVIGNASMMKEFAVSISPAEPMASEYSQKGVTTIYVARNGELAGIFGVADTLKPTTRDAIAGLKEMNIEVVMLTGDNERVASAIAREAGIDRYIAGALPGEKAQKIKELQVKGKVVAMVGDGVNDAPALAQADVGIAIGTGTDVAIETSDITLMKGDLRSVLQAIQLSKLTMRTIKQNLFWAFIYNVVGIPIAAFGLLNPMYAAAAMAFSSVSVVSNSLRIRNKKL